MGKQVLRSGTEQLSAQSEVSVRGYESGDETRIVPFLQRCMEWPTVRIGVPRIEHWRWKYLSNPLGFHLVCLAEQGENIVSHSASIPVLLKLGDNIVLASQGVDLCTDPSFRGRGIIGQTMACRNRMKDAHGVALDFGFPNHAAYHLSLIKQGFTDLGLKIMQHRFIANESRFFKKVRYGQIKRIGYGSYMLMRRSFQRKGSTENGLVLGHEERFGPDVDDLYRGASSDFDIMIAREHRYLNWRFGDRRGGDFIIRTARRNGGLVGYMVHKLEEREGTSYLNIVDALVSEVEEDVLSELLSDATDMARSMGIDTVLMCLPQGHPYEAQLGEQGFLAEQRYTGDRPMSVIVLPRELDAESKRILFGGNLRAHIMLGDTDWV